MFFKLKSIAKSKKLLSNQYETTTLLDVKAAHTLPNRHHIITSYLRTFCQSNDVINLMPMIVAVVFVFLLVTQSVIISLGPFLWSLLAIHQQLPFCKQYIFKFQKQGNIRSSLCCKMKHSNLFAGVHHGPYCRYLSKKLL